MQHCLLVTALGAAIAGGGCRERMPQVELLGSWRLARAPRQLAVGRSIVLLNGDRTFVATDFPRILVDIRSDVARELLTGRGHWRLRNGNDEQSVELVFDSTDSNLAMPVAAELHVYRTRFDFYLYGSSDPDLGPEFIYQK
jgi:hypothetical protein